MDNLVAMGILGEVFKHDTFLYLLLGIFNFGHYK